MSRAFVKEDIDVPERTTRWRSASGLPPGALNYLTEAGAQRLRQQVAELKNDAADEDERAELEGVLDSVTIVKAPERPDTVMFGVRVTLRSDTGEIKNCRIVGVDEVDLLPQQVSWVSPVGKALLGAKLGQRVSLEPSKPPRWTVVSLE